MKITLLSPVHIGTGHVYHNFLIYKDHRYDFDAFLKAGFKRNETRLMSEEFLTTLSQLRQNESMQAKKMISDYLTPTIEELKTIKPRYKVDVKLPLDDLKQKDVFEHIKNLNQLMIPGSSLKGVIMNVIMFDIFEQHDVIRNFYKNKFEQAVRSNPRKPEFSREVKDLSSMELRVLSDVSNFLVCRDILFDDAPVIRQISRQTKNSPIPQVAECIDTYAKAEGVFIESQSMRKRQTHRDSVEEELSKAVFDRIQNLDTRFAEMNKRFMLNALQYVRAFIKDGNRNLRVDVHAALEQLDDIENRLHQGEIIMQLGKYGNYISKSISQVFGKDFYIQHFESLFNPGPTIQENKARAYPYKIGSMNLVASDMDPKLFDTIPGFVSLAW